MPSMQSDQRKSGTGAQPNGRVDLEFEKYWPSWKCTLPSCPYKDQEHLKYEFGQALFGAVRSGGRECRNRYRCDKRNSWRIQPKNAKWNLGGSEPGAYAHLEENTAYNYPRTDGKPGVGVPILGTADSAQKTVHVYSSSTFSGTMNINKPDNLNRVEHRLSVAYMLKENQTDEQIDDGLSPSKYALLLIFAVEVVDIAHLGAPVFTLAPEEMQRFELLQHTFTKGLALKAMRQIGVRPQNLDAFFQTGSEQSLWPGKKIEAPLPLFSRQDVYDVHHGIRDANDLNRSEDPSRATSPLVRTGSDGLYDGSNSTPMSGKRGYSGPEYRPPGGTSYKRQKIPQSVSQIHLSGLNVKSSNGQEPRQAAPEQHNNQTPMHAGGGSRRRSDFQHARISPQQGPDSPSLPSSPSQPQGNGQAATGASSRNERSYDNADALRGTPRPCGTDRKRERADSSASHGFVEEGASDVRSPTSERSAVKDEAAVTKVESVESSDGQGVPATPVRVDSPVDVGADVGEKAREKRNVESVERQDAVEDSVDETIQGSEFDGVAGSKQDDVCEDGGGAERGLERLRSPMPAGGDVSTEGPWMDETTDQDSDDGAGLEEGEIYDEPVNSGSRGRKRKRSSSPSQAITGSSLDNKKTGIAPWLAELIGYRG